MLLGISLSLSCLMATAACASLLIAPRGTNQSWPNPEPCHGNCSQCHDPNVIKRPDGTWFRFSTLGNIAISTAPEIYGPWTYQGEMLPNGSMMHVTDTQTLWAPDVHLVHDKYYAYYCASMSGLQNSSIGVATSQTMEPGSWVDHGSLHLPHSSEYNLIDANLFRDHADSEPYFQFGSAWDGIFQTRLSLDYKSQAKHADSPINLAYNSTIPTGDAEPSITEGSYLFSWHHDGEKQYYLFFSSGTCCKQPPNLSSPGDEYKIMVCRSKSPSGPFVDHKGRSCLTDNGGTLVLGSHGEVYAPGGQGAHYDADLGQPFIYYHYVNTTIGYESGQFHFGFNYLDFSSGWPIVVPKRHNTTL